MIIDGGLGGLAAAWAASACQPGSAGDPVLLACTSNSPHARARRAAVKRQVEATGAKRVVELLLPEGADRLLVNEPTTDAAARRILSHLLLDGCLEALRLDVAEVIWPVHSRAASEAELRVEVIADACDRSLLIGQLATLDAPRTGPGSNGVRLETPYADLTDLQLAELLVDLGAPVTAAWWCEGNGDRQCASCATCLRWAATLKKAAGRTIIGS